MNKTKVTFFIMLISGFFVNLVFCGSKPKEKTVVIQSWITSWDGKFKLTPQKNILTVRKEIKDSIIIRIHPEVKRQPILGFGGTFTDADVYNFMRMSKPVRTEALKSLFDPKEGAGWNLMRISFGSSDWDRDWNFYTYDDMLKGQKDDSLLSHFSVAEDLKRGHFELIREALQINPELKIHASVWGPPAWMKDNDQLISDGTILPQYYDEYALYLVKSIEAYAKEGIKIMAVSPQNEPLCNDGRKTPQALYMDWKPMRDMVQVIKKTLVQHQVDTELWIFDHNFIFAKTWVEPFLTDRTVNDSFDGVAWHDYEGSEAELSELYAKYPDVPMYHTERSHYTSYGLMRILKMIRSGVRSHNHWVTISDEYGGPYQYGGGNQLITKPAPETDLSAIYNFRENADKWVKTTGYYTFAHITKFIKRGAVRIDSDDSGSILANAAFRNPDGTIVLIVSNCGKKESSFVVSLDENYALLKLPPESAASYIIQ